MPPKSNRKSSARKSGKSDRKGKGKGKGGGKLVTAPIPALPTAKPDPSQDPVYDITTDISKGPIEAVEPFNLQKINKDAPPKVAFVDPDGTPLLPQALTNGEEVTWVAIGELDMYKENASGLKIHCPDDGPRTFHGLRAPNNWWAQLFASHCSLIVQQKNRITTDSGLLWELIYPQDKMGPKVSDKNQYKVKLFHQGQWCAFTIDDQVPVGADGIPLLPVSKNPNEIWPLIIGKALLKLFHGEDIGSHGTELFYSLCGWIPQEISLSDTTSQEQGFHWFSELKKSVLEGDNASDGTVIAGLCFSELSGKKPSIEKEDGKGGVYTQNQKFGACMISPHMGVKPSVLEDDEEDQKSAKGKKTPGGQKGAKGKKSPPKKGGKQTPSTSAREETAEEKKVFVIDSLDFLDLITEKTETMKKEALPGLFDSVWMLYNPANFVNQHSFDHVWTEKKKPFHSQQPCYIHVPPEVKEEDLQALEEEVQVEEEKTPAAPTFAKLLFSIEAHLPVTARSGEDEEGANVPAVYGEASKPLFTVTMDKYEWETNKRSTLNKLVSRVHRGTLEVTVPIGINCMYILNIDSPCGYYTRLFSSHKVHMESRPEMGTLFQACLGITSEHHQGSYATQPANSWFVIAKTTITVQEEGWDPDAPQDKGKGKGGKDKGTAKGATSGRLADVKCTFQPPFADEHETFISTHVDLNEPALFPYITLEWVDNDTLQTSRCGLLHTRNLKFKPNENGYTMVISCDAPIPVYGGGFNYTLLSSKPLASHHSEPIQVTDFTAPAVPDSEYSIFRNVLASTNAQPCGVAVRIGLSDPTAGFTVNAYDAEDVANIEEGDPPLRPFTSLSSIGCVVFPMLEVAKESPKVLLEMKLDPLTPGEVLQKEEDKESDETKEGEEKSEAPEPIKWTMNCVSPYPIVLAMDKTRDNEFQEIKTAWEKAQSGRAKRAKASRDKFLEAQASLNSLNKPPIWTTVPELERRALGADELEAARDLIVKEDNRAENLLLKMIQIRDEEIAASSVSSEQREQELAAWRAEQLTKAETELAERSSYYNKLNEYEANLATLKDSLQQQIPTVYDIDSVTVARPASRKGGGKAAKGGGGTAMSTFVETIQAAIEGVTNVPKWRSEKLVNQAYGAIQKACIGTFNEALQIAYEPVPVEEPGTKKKKGAEEKPDPTILLSAAVEHARTLTGRQTTFEIEAWIDRAGRHIHETRIASFDTILNPPDEEEPADLTDGDVIENLQDVLTKIETLGRELNEQDTAIVTKVKGIIEHYNETSAEDETSARGKKSGRKGKK